MTSSTLLSTDAVAPRDRAPQWSEWISRHFCGLQSDLYGDSDFDGHIAASHAGDVILTRLEANRHRVLRTPSMARTSDVGYLKIVAPWQGSATVQQQGRQACARDGAWVVYDTTGAYEIANPERCDHLIVMVPKDAVAERGLRFEGVMARRLGASGISRVTLETLRNTYQELPHMSAAAAQGAGETIKQLVRLSLMELWGQETAVTQREALRDRIRAHVQQHLRDPELSVDTIARALNCSRRHLYNAFTGEGGSIAGFIQRLRLEACVRELQHGGSRPITDIALSWGFGNPSHFSRVFRDHTGMSPSAFRGAPLR
ncbi:MAG TPA: helix-turn-helix domain-containing protein [Ramlibacter sp.]|jgi:AraC-like DNA-binding protein|uniref:helix-turn-helix domain-containing protein n=1 Tax=Ramlibacter sp. TaxID=1917967 RepID=UPI002D710212|nr:helix-turn-helix domain-containing protein [Ramlibacter sp.]HZY17653.1 helix-turn-helix domain-containing protein [Ramlibacter sp.]